MAKWNINRNGPNWLMDATGRIYGYQDQRGKEYAIPQMEGNWGDAEVAGPTDSSLRVLSGVSGDGTRIGPARVGQKLGITDGAIQTADQIIGQIAIPKNALKVGDFFGFIGTLGRDNGTDAYGSATAMRMGAAGTVVDTAVANTNLSSLFTGGGTQLSIGFEKFFRVVSIGANSVIEVQGPSGSIMTSYNGLSTSGGAVALQITLTGWDLSTQAGFFSISTTMGAATATKPRTGSLCAELRV